MMDTKTKKILRYVIATQCVSAPSLSSFQNGFMLAYLATIGLSNVVILQLLALPSLLSFLVKIPSAILSDRVGKKNVGNFGLYLTVLGFGLITVAGSMESFYSSKMVTLGIVVFGIGFAAFASNWYALLNPLIPEDLRGRFFGKARALWQLVTITVSLLAVIMLQHFSSIPVFQFTLALITLMLAIRIIFYRRIPEIEQSKKWNFEFFKSVRNVFSISGYKPFCAYLFFLSLLTGACPWIFGLLEKDVLYFSEDQIVLMGTFHLLGLLLGNYGGGKIVDRIGTKRVFLVCNFLFILILFLFIVRDWIPTPMIITIGILVMGFGVVFAAVLIAITSELLALISHENQSLATAIATTLQSGAFALAAYLFASILETGLFTEPWHFLGSPMSKYDILLCGAGIMIVLLTAALGVPLIIKNMNTAKQTLSTKIDD